MDRIKEIASSIYAKLKAEPVLVMYGILFVINALAVFGYNVDPELIAKVDVILIPALALVTRKKVAPLSTLEPMTVEEFIEKFGEGTE